MTSQTRMAHRRVCGPSTNVVGVAWRHRVYERRWFTLAFPRNCRFIITSRSLIRRYGDTWSKGELTGDSCDWLLFFCILNDYVRVFIATVFILLWPRFDHRTDQWKNIKTIETKRLWWLVLQIRRNFGVEKALSRINNKLVFVCGLTSVSTKMAI